MNDHEVLNAAGPVVLRMVDAVPPDLASVKWFAAFAEKSTPSTAGAVQFLARLYVAADNHCAGLQAQVDASLAAAKDFYDIVKRHRAVLTELAYGDGALPEQRKAAVALLGGAGLSRYHVYEEVSA